MGICTPWRDNYAMLCTYRDALAQIPAVASCKIGIEVNITAADYPLIRLVLEDSEDANTLYRESTTLAVYAGCKLFDFAAGGIEAQYEWLLATDVAIREAITSAPSESLAVWKRSVYDGDQLPGYKVMVAFFAVQ